MSSNFEFLTGIYDEFAKEAKEAEQSLVVSPSTCAILSRRALELAVRFVFTFDNELKLPYQDNISSLIHERTFRSIIEPRLFPMLKYVIWLGNKAVHTNKKITRDDAIVSLRDLFEFCDWIDYSYSRVYKDKQFDESILPSGEDKRMSSEELQKMYDKMSSKDRKLEDMIKENEELREQMAKIKQQNIQSRNFTINEMSEELTRKKYIDVELEDAGWVIGKNCMEEVEVQGMPNATGKGYVVYVLYGKDRIPLAVVEAKRASVDPIVGSQQAKLYADCLQNQYGVRPLIFTTNGFETYYTNDYAGFAKRRVAGFFTQEELQLEIDRRKTRKPLENLEISDEITNRPYQKEAVTAVCDAIAKKHRKMLIVQATGSGKTRVSISIVDVLRRHNYVKNILFLADRKALVKQAKNNYSNLLPGLSCCNLLDNKEDPEASRMIFSTYPTMMNAIDEKKRKDGSRMFSPAHFDLIIIDEAHRSIYKKYQEIFDYFDAYILGMTATPKDDVGKNTYRVFDLENGNPTYDYELEQAVKEKYLVSYSTLEYKTKIMEDGIRYNELSEEEKESFEESFGIEEGDTPLDIEASAINNWLFNLDTIDKVLIELMKNGLKVEGGDKLGKTIIFAKNSEHAKIIVERFHVMFPEFGGDFIKQIDYSIKYVDTLIDDFSSKEKYPQIAVSVDMLDTGIDIPEILNLVFFKKIRSYSKFWQMIGRGTRLCPNLFGEGQDKESFLIFDFCNNFEFFSVKTNGKETGVPAALSEKIFNVKTGIARELQAPVFAKQEEYVNYRRDLVDELHHTVIELDTTSFRVKNHLRFVEMFRQKKAWDSIESEQMRMVKEHIAPLVMPEKEDELARRFDYLLYSIELGVLQSKNVQSQVNTVVTTAAALEKKTGIPQVKAQLPLLSRVQTVEFWQQADVMQLDRVREVLRELIRFLDKINTKSFYVDVEDKIIEEKKGDPIYAVNNLENYRKNVEYYLKEHKTNIAVYKLRSNKKLTKEDLHSLEEILWHELGSREDYQKEYGDTPIGMLVRKIVGVDTEAVNEAFSEFLTEERLNINQIRFVRLLVDYISRNGNIEDRKVLQDEPFRSVGSIVTLFKDDMETAKKIMDVVEEIKNNSVVTA